MSSPVTPNDFKSTIPAAGASLCDKLAKAFTLPSFVYQLVAYLMDANGKSSSEFAADMCAAQAKFGGCNGISTQNPNMPSPVIQASDGAFSDKVQVTWTGVVTSGTIPAATFYKIYRSSSATENTADAVLLTTVSAVVGSNSYNDSTAVPGTTYWYWVKATNGTDESGFSTGNQGYAASVTGTIDAVSDLRVTKGHAPTDGYPLSLVWTPVAGATKWDIYRNTVDDGSTATLIDTNRSPSPTTTILPPDLDVQQFWDNDGELVYFDVPPVGSAIYYYWVVAKKDSPPATSVKSNSDWGTVQNFVVGGTTAGALAMVRDDVFDATGYSKIRFVLTGTGGGGAGSGEVYGGGGGGGSALITGEHAPAAAAKYRVVVVPNQDDTGNAAIQGNGSSGMVVKLQYSALGTFGDTVDIATCAASGPGLYASSGSGSGGDGGTGSTTGVANPAIHNGAAGQSGAAGVGGKGGNVFGGRRIPAFVNGPSGDGAGGANKGSFGTGGNTGKLAEAGQVVIAYGS